MTVINDYYTIIYMKTRPLSLLYFFLVMIASTFAYAQAPSVISTPLVCKAMAHINADSLRAGKFYRHTAPCSIYTGSADFHGLTLDSAAHFDKSIFNPTANFSEAIFHARSWFDHSRFLSPAAFDAARFFWKVSFYKTIFYGPISFEEVVFDSMVNCFGAQVAARADFEGAHFRESGSFYGMAFLQESNFARADFKQKSYFSKARFYGPVNFTEATLGAQAFFNQAMFEDDADFSGVVFDQMARFSDASFSSNVVWDDVVLPDTLYMDGVDAIAQVLDFTTCRYEPNAEVYIDLTGAAIDKMVLDYTHFKLFFPPAHGLSAAAEAGIYEALLQVQKVHGFSDGYRKLDKAYREHTYLASHEYVRNWFEKYWLNYGYNPAWPILRNLAMLLAMVVLVRWLLMMLRGRRATV